MKVSRGRNKQRLKEEKNFPMCSMRDATNGANMNGKSNACALDIIDSTVGFILTDCSVT